MDSSAVKILKVCFCTNNSLGKNFKLVKCDSSWQVRVRLSEGPSPPPHPHPHSPGLKNRLCLCLPKAIIRSILISGRLGPNIEHVGCYALLLKHLKSEELHWLHPDLTVQEVEQRYESHHVEAEWRYAGTLTRAEGRAPEKPDSDKIRFDWYQPANQSARNI